MQNSPSLSNCRNLTKPMLLKAPISNSLALINLLLMISICPFAYASHQNHISIPAHFPSTLLYHNQPINPNCLVNLENTQTTISLNKCSKLDKNQKITGSNKKFISQGYVGYDYSLYIGKNIPTVVGYSYYKVIGQADNNVIVQTEWNGGGNGFFTSIVAIQRDNNTLKVDTLDGGDRCNGGISAAQLANGKLTYQAFITPGDLLALSGINPHHLKPYDDLDACAACCIGTAKFVINVINKFNDRQLLAIELNKELTSISRDNYQNRPYQLCFDQHLNQYKQSGKTEMTTSELKQFMQEFALSCSLQAKQK